MMRMHALMLATLFTTTAVAGPPDFSGQWTLDFRTPAERSQKIECGSAEFVLTQQGNRVTGSHSMASVGCGRVNEGDGDSVKGVIVDQTAVLVVTSGRNGAVVFGIATVRDGSLHWEVLDEIYAGEPADDSPLIMWKGILSRSDP